MRRLRHHLVVVVVAANLLLAAVGQFGGRDGGFPRPGNGGRRPTFPGGGSGRPRFPGFGGGDEGDDRPTLPDRPISPVAPPRDDPPRVIGIPGFPRSPPSSPISRPVGDDSQQPILPGAPPSSPSDDDRQILPDQPVVTPGDDDASDRPRLPPGGNGPPVDGPGDEDGDERNRRPIFPFPGLTPGDDDPNENPGDSPALTPGDDEDEDRRPILPRPDITPRDDDDVDEQPGDENPGILPGAGDDEDDEGLQPINPQQPGDDDTPIIPRPDDDQEPIVPRLPGDQDGDERPGDDLPDVLPGVGDEDNDGDRPGGGLPGWLIGDDDDGRPFDRPRWLPDNDNKWPLDTVRDIGISLPRGGGLRRPGGPPGGWKDDIFPDEALRQRERPIQVGISINIGIGRDPLWNARPAVRYFPRRAPFVPPLYRTPYIAPVVRPPFVGYPKFVYGSAFRYPVAVPVRVAVGWSVSVSVGGWWYPYLAYYHYPYYHLRDYYANACVTGGTYCYYNSDCCSGVCIDGAYTCGAAYFDYSAAYGAYNPHTYGYRQLQDNNATHTLPPPPPVSRLPPAYDENMTLAFLPPDEAPYVPEAYTGSPLPPVGLGVNTTAGRAALVSLPEYEALEGQLFETNGTFVYNIGNVTYFFVPDNETSTETASRNNAQEQVDLTQQLLSAIEETKTTGTNGR